jgi:hypothetical protein
MTVLRYTERRSRPLANERKGGGKTTAAHRVGGDWTKTKLAVLANYLAAYTTALKKTPFELLYLDTFAGTGCRTTAVLPRYHIFNALKRGIRTVLGKPEVELSGRIAVASLREAADA